MARVVKPNQPLAHRIYGKYAVELDECDKLESEAWREHSAKRLDDETLGEFLDHLELRRANAQAKLRPAPKPEKQTFVVRRHRELSPLQVKIFLVVLFLIYLKFF